ncbi:hypothetical protein ElyMa_002995700 [Elysia marginata]|uniref:Uncharacterized protein n=1 Tax=Elysia marginata TaxID=1093978 RepID=A0AAV4IBP9_9GAST|nr:hypothetical protein ElyMa_002995700 [Elysia marginata]
MRRKGKEEETEERPTSRPKVFVAVETGHLIEHTDMLKLVLMVCLSLAIMAMYTEAIFSSHRKEITVGGISDTAEGIDMDDGHMRINKRSILSRRGSCWCRRRICNCRVMSRLACLYCLYLRHRCYRFCNPYDRIVNT